jgi:hypothetical protein
VGEGGGQRAARSEREEGGGREGGLGVCGNCVDEVDAIDGEAAADVGVELNGERRRSGAVAVVHDLEGYWEALNVGGDPVVLNPNESELGGHVDRRRVPYHSAVRPRRQQLDVSMRVGARAPHLMDHVSAALQRQECRRRLQAPASDRAARGAVRLDAHRRVSRLCRPLWRFARLF